MRNPPGRFPATSALVLATLWSLLGGAGSSYAANPKMADHGNLFSDATVNQTNDLIQEIKQRFAKDLTIETFASIPESLQPRLKSEGKAQFYNDWIQHEARRANTNGVFVLIVKKPGHVQVAVGDKTQRKAFTLADRDELSAILLKQFRDEKFDQGILDGAKFVLDRMGRNLNGNGGAAEPTTAPSGEEKPESDFPQTRPTTRPTTLPVPPDAFIKTNATTKPL